MKVGIIGHFGGNNSFNDGQTVKTLALDRAFRRNGVEDILQVDTYYIRHNPARFAFQLLQMAIICKKIVVLLSVNGRRVLFPVLYLMAKYGGKEIYHDAIGGRLAQETEEKKQWRKYLVSFQSNWVESKQLAEQLKKLGVDNAEYLPNFKKLQILDSAELEVSHKAPFRLCTFSRVMKEKGIGDAIEAVESINSEEGHELVTLDIYGPIEKAYEESFQHSISNSKSCKYCGIVDAEQSVEVLKAYDVLLFPTYWKAEGMPGTIIDALSAGLPVIARKWPYCDEMLTNGETGFIYAFEQPELLKDKIRDAVSHPELIMEMKKKCLKKAFLYSEDYVVPQIMSKMRLPGKMNDIRGR